MLNGTAAFTIFPMVLYECEDRNRDGLTSIMTTVSFAAVGIFTVFGVFVGAILDSPNIPEMVTFAFAKYTFGSETMEFYHIILNKIIMLLPVLCVFTSGPIVAQTLAENLA
jgi:hypothetical protein